jgi:predicted polyphosphate/ATP-dependent NAD kinase
MMNDQTRAFRLGLIVNPVAGLGGSVALKGSDGKGTAKIATRLGAEPKAQERTLTALSELKDLPVKVITYAGDMGENVARLAGFELEVIGAQSDEDSSPNDTEAAAEALLNAGVDLIAFVGGDGTARNVCRVVPETTPVLGIPAGVKIHSGVYAVNPTAAGRVIAMLVKGELVSFTEREVRDIDEDQFREGRVSARYYGVLSVPEEHRYVQSVKNGGKESEELVLDDIVADVVERMEPDTRYIMGSGTTVKAIMEHLGLDNTLLGVDLVENESVVASDCKANQLLQLCQQNDGKETKLIITLIGGQGHIFGRGNQQISPELIRYLGKENIWIVATKSKLNALDGRPLRVDTGDAELDLALEGVWPVITGYRDQVLYRVEA